MEPYCIIPIKESEATAYKFILAYRPVIKTIDGQITELTIKILSLPYADYTIENVIRHVLNHAVTAHGFTHIYEHIELYNDEGSNAARNVLFIYRGARILIPIIKNL